jgi:fibronectin type 3 domain-containing protein
MFVVYGTGEEELYDLVQDPFELANVVTDPAYQPTAAALRTRIQQLCTPAPPAFQFQFDALPPSTPTDPAAPMVLPGEVDLTWAPSIDNEGVAGYTVYRDGVALGTVDALTTAFVDVTVTPGVAYAYTVDAFDNAGNHSPPSDPPLVVTTPP